jgi:hypothetical protein
MPLSLPSRMALIVMRINSVVILPIIEVKLLNPNLLFRDIRCAQCGCFASFILS